MKHYEIRRIAYTGKIALHSYDISKDVSKSIATKNVSYLMRNGSGIFFFYGNYCSTISLHFSAYHLYLSTSLFFFKFFSMQHAIFKCTAENGKKIMLLGQGSFYFDLVTLYFMDYGTYLGSQN